jgi:hypothetical protein
LHGCLLEDSTAAISLCGSGARLLAVRSAFVRCGVVVHAQRGGCLELAGCALRANGHVARASSRVVVRVRRPEAHELRAAGGDERDDWQAADAAGLYC